MQFDARCETRPSSPPSACPPSAHRSHTRFTSSIALVIRAATTGGTFYPVGGALSTLVRVKLEPTHNISVSAISSAVCAGVTEPSPPELIDVPTNSLIRTGERSSLSLSRMSDTK